MELFIAQITPKRGATWYRLVLANTEQEATKKVREKFQDLIEIEDIHITTPIQ